MALGYLAGEIDNDLQATRAAIAITRINLDSGRGAECRTRAKKLRTRVRRVLAMS